MQGCNNDFGKLIGKNAVLRLAWGCPDIEPAISEWLRMGAMTTKSVDFAMNTLTSDADDAAGLTENVVTGMDLTISGDGEWRKRAKTTEIGPLKMAQYIFNEVRAGRQPGLWVRFDYLGTEAGTYIMGYFNTTSWSDTFGSSDFATFSGEWKVADADSVRFVTDDDIRVTGVTVAPGTLSLTVSEQKPLTGTVAPADATNSEVKWTSSDESIATVSSTGLVTAIAEGSATITCTALDGGASGSCAVQVAAE